MYGSVGYPSGCAGTHYLASLTGSSHWEDNSLLAACQTCSAGCSWWVVRVCHLRLFRVSLFPRACLRQSLALYYLLSRLGYAVTIHFGVRKEEDILQGHSWVTVQGTPLAEHTPVEIFHVVYSYPPALSCSTHHEAGRVQGK